MRNYDDQIQEEIFRELSLVWEAHKRLRLEGEMRVFTVDKAGSWHSNQTGLELWFGPGKIEDTVGKIMTFYRQGQKPNTVFLLDPIVYKRGDSPVPMPIGSGIIWCTILGPKGKKISEETVARIHSMGLQADYLKTPDNPRAGLKIWGVLDQPSIPAKGSYNENGTIIPGIQEIFDLANVEMQGDQWKNYLLSGLQYECDEGVYQHERLTDLFNGANCSALQYTGVRPVRLQKILDAAVCWNAYDRIPALFERYGIDVANLESNLHSKREIDAVLKGIKRELSFIFAVQRMHGLEGKMRIFSDKEQQVWRAKEPGFEFWVGPETMDHAIAHILHLYNGGLLPNTPLFLDPVIHQQDASGAWMPLGTGIAWASALCTGRQKYIPEMKKRMDDIGVLSSPIMRGGNAPSGLKVLAILDTPIQPKPGTPAVEGCNELFQVADANGEAYWPYYMLSGMEYLSSHGAFKHVEFESLLAGKPATTVQDIKKLTVKLQRIKDAATCWNGYDRIHRLWNHFGIDAAKLEDNLKYFNLCGRDFELLGASKAFEDEETIKLESETFNFIVDGWIPKGAVTLIAAAGGTGKSSAAHNLCVKAAIDYREGEEPPLWMGGRLRPENCQGMCIYFSGEDGPAIVNERAKLFDPEGRARRLMFQRVDFGTNAKGEKASIGDFLDKLRKLPHVPIVVIDPARKYLEGDENDADVVSNFFEAIENFAVEKNTAMVVVHHLQKGAKPKGSVDVLEELRGSQVFIDRPRVIIGMTREDKHTVVGLSKCNIPPSLGMAQGDRVFVRNADTLEMDWIPGAAGIQGNAFITKDELKALQEEAERKKKSLKT